MPGITKIISIILIPYNYSSLLMKVYDGEPLQVLFKFSGAQATRRISRAQLPFWSQSLFLFQIRRLTGTDSREST